jgi:hypothetical protein
VGETGQGLGNPKLGCTKGMELRGATPAQGRRPRVRLGVASSNSNISNQIDHTARKIISAPRWIGRRDADPEDVGSVVDEGNVTAWVATGWASHWKSQLLDTTLGNNEGSLQGVSCVTVTSCVAVGWANPAGEYAASGLTELLSDGAWTASSDAPNAVGTSIPGVDCPVTTSSCAAVGTSNGGPMIVWLQSGGNYEVVPIAGATYPDLFAVSCASASSCEAISSGKIVHVGPSRAATAAQVVAPGASSAGLGGISCPTATSCTVVGSEQTTTGIFATAATTDPTT